MKRNKLAEAEKLLEYIHNLIQQLPGGVDKDADENDTSPEDQVAHIGGLIFKKIEAYFK